MAYDENYDYTAGESIPEETLNADNFSIGGSGATEFDPNKIEAENSFHDLEPGNYLLKVIGFGKIELKAKTTFINGQAVQYSAPQVEVRFADADNPSGRIRAYFLLPPDDATFLKYYNTGGNEKGSVQSVGFFAKQFAHFIDRLFPEAAYTVVNGRKVLSDQARSLANWKGRAVWAQVEMGKTSGNVDPTTGDPYPARPQIKMYSYRAYEAGAKCPHGEKGPRAALPGGQATGATGGRTAAAALAGAGAGHAGVNGAALAAASGLDDI